MAKQEHEPTMAEVLSRMTAIMEEQAKATQKDAMTEPTEKTLIRSKRGERAAPRRYWRLRKQLSA
jgi:hypothetical protein